MINITITNEQPQNPPPGLPEGQDIHLVLRLRLLPPQKTPAVQPAHPLDHHARQKRSPKGVDFQLRQTAPPPHPQKKEREPHPPPHHQVPMLQTHQPHQPPGIQKHPRPQIIRQIHHKLTKRRRFLQPKEKYRSADNLRRCAAIVPPTISRLCRLKQTSRTKFLRQVETYTVKSQPQQIGLVLHHRQCPQKPLNLVQIQQIYSHSDRQ